MEKVRLQKFLAHCGVDSRRKCEQLILDGRVSVNGEVVRELGVKVSAVDKVCFDGAPIENDHAVYIMLNKPPECICSIDDSEGRRSFRDFIPEELGRLFTVGRLDFMSEGLLLVTNDGDFANRVMHPRYEVHKTYVAETVEKLTDEQLARIREGITDFEGVKLPVRKILPIQTSRHCAYKITLGEGKNRHIRRIFAELGVHMVTLKRVSAGPVKLEELRSGKWRHLTDEEVAQLLKQEVGHD